MNRDNEPNGFIKIPSQSAFYWAYKLKFTLILNADQQQRTRLRDNVMEKFRGHLKISELPFDPTDITTKVDFGFRYNGSGINQGLQKEMSKPITDISETIFLHEFLSLSGVSIDQIKTNKQNW